MSNASTPTSHFLDAVLLEDDSPSWRSTHAACFNRAASRAKSPTVSNDGAGHEPVISIRPCVGRIPYKPQKLAGILTEPPVSPPSPTSASLLATATAVPDEDPLEYDLDSKDSQGFHSDNSVLLYYMPFHP